MTRRQSGFTLVELMIVVVIVGIIASVAIPGYQDHVRQSRRADAKALLMEIHMAEERYRATNSTYAQTLNALGYGAANLANYNLNFNYNAGPPETYTLTATATGDQANDNGCTTFTINQDGPANGCWR